MCTHALTVVMCKGQPACFLGSSSGKLAVTSDKNSCTASFSCNACCLSWQNASWAHCSKKLGPKFCITFGVIWDPRILTGCDIGQQLVLVQKWNYHISRANKLRWSWHKLSDVQLSAYLTVSILKAITIPTMEAKTETKALRKFRRILYDMTTE